MRVYLEGIGLRAPGLDGWAGSRPILAGDRPYVPGPTNLPPSPLLPANERRRTVPSVKLALLVGSEAFDNARRDPQATATVFASAGGDGETIHVILEALASAELEVSPTRFHNSVHNAPSGYWNIATKAREPTTSLTAYDASFAAGLLDAAVQATVDNRAVGLVSYDLPYPEPLHATRPINSVFGVALVLAPAPSAAAFACLTISLGRDSPITAPLIDPDLESLRAKNPAARCLPLLMALARRDTARIVLEHVSGNRVVVSVQPAPS